MKTVCERYQLTPHIIGRGSYSQVVKGIDIWDNREVAVKCIDWNQLKKHAEYRKIKENKCPKRNRVHATDFLSPYCIIF